MAGLRILVVEDEQDLRNTLAYALRREGYEVVTAGDATSALRLVEVPCQLDLILLDLMLPDRPGTEVCRKVRAQPETSSLPIIMLTARDEEIDRVVGFELGADDYVTKPFSVRELMLRVRAQLRRTHTAPRLNEKQPGTLTFGVLELDVSGHRVTVEGTLVELTSLELKLLNTLMCRSGRVQTRDTLLADVWGYQPDVETRTVDTHIRRLRNKLGAAGAYLETIRGVGYRFTDSEETS